LSDCAQDSGPSKVFVEIVLVWYVLDTDHVAYDLMYPFNDGIRLRIPCGNPFDSDPVFILESCLHFGFELSALIHPNFGWPRIASEPMELEEVGYEVSLLGWDLCDLEPSHCRVNHCNTPQLCVGVDVSLLVDLAKRVRTDKVDT
jgi:hypothetical protein